MSAYDFKSHLVSTDWGEHWNEDVSDIFRKHSQASGQYAENYSQQVANYHFHPSMPNQRKIPASIDDMARGWEHPSVDVVGGWVHERQTQLFEDGYKRGAQKLIQQQSHTPARKLRGQPNTFTRELRHPHDPVHPAYETSMKVHQFIPKHPSERQVQEGMYLANVLGAHTMLHRAGEQYFASAPHVPFRYESRRG